MVTRDDIEAKARQIQDAVDETREAAQNTAVMAGVAVIVMVIIAFLIGRKRGRGGQAIVEVYRVK